jgi:hypothetical protein
MPQHGPELFFFAAKIFGQTGRKIVPRVRNQCSGSALFQCGSRSRVLIIKNWEKITAEKILVFSDEKLQFSYP